MNAGERYRTRIGDCVTILDVYTAYGTRFIRYEYDTGAIRIFTRNIEFTRGREKVDGSRFQAR